MEPRNSRRWIAAVALAACAETPSTVYPPPNTREGEAWQMFVVGPFRTMTSQGVVTHPVGEPLPSWAETAELVLDLSPIAQDRWSATFTFTTGLGLRHEDCAIEIITDDAARKGVRISRPTNVKAGATSRSSTWTMEFTARARPETATIFCPIDSAHRSPPWGIVIDSRH